MVEFSLFNLPDINSVQAQQLCEVEPDDLTVTEGTIARPRAKRIKEAMQGLATRPGREK